MTDRRPTDECLDYVSRGLVAVAFIVIPSLIRWSFIWRRSRIVVKVAEEGLEEDLPV